MQERLKQTGRAERLQRIKLMKHLTMYIVILLGLMVSGCGVIRSGGPIKEPILEHGWSEPYDEFINGESHAIQCITIEDKQKIDWYIEACKGLTNIKEE